MSKSESLTITLTARQPVKIKKDDWPLVASSRDYDNQYEFQANQTWSLYVRQHADGRAIVYGVYTTNYQNAYGRRGGEMVEKGGDIPAAIIRVGQYLEFKRELADQCVADLPAEEV